MYYKIIYLVAHCANADMSYLNVLLPLLFRSMLRLQAIECMQKKLKSFSVGCFASLRPQEYYLRSIVIPFPCGAFHYDDSD